MSKLGLALASLIVAIPGAFLTYLLVMTFINNADNLSGAMWAISVTTLLSTVLMAVMPVGVMLFGPKTEDSDADVDDVADDEFGDDDDSFAADTSDADLNEFDDDEDDLVADADDELSMDDDFDDDSSETMSDDDEDLFMEDDDLGLEMEDDDDDFK